MAETYAQNLSEAILLLSKVSGKLDDKADALKQKESKAEDKKESKIEKLFSFFNKKNAEVKKPKEVNKINEIVSYLKARQEEVSEKNKEPEQVVEKAKPVIITEFGRKAEKSLVDAFKIDKEEAKPEKVEEESGIMSWVRKLIGPALLLLGGIAAFVTGLLEDSGLKGFFTGLGKLGIKGALMLMAKKIGGFIGKKLLKRIPIVGAILGFADAWTRFKSDDYVGGTIALLSGLVSLVDLAVPGLGTTLSIGLDILNTVLDAETAEIKGPSKRTQAKLGLLQDWAVKVGKFLAELPIIRNLVQFGEGIGDILTGNYVDGFTKMAYANPVFSYFAELAGLPPTPEKMAQQVKAFDLEKAFNDAMQPVYRGILNRILPSWMSGLISIDPNTGQLSFTPGKLATDLTERVQKFLGISGSEKIAKESGEAAIIGQARAVDLARKKLDEFNKSRNYIGRDKLSDKDKEEFDSLLYDFEMYKEKAATMKEQVKDFIQTPDGKTLKPAKDDTIVGFKPNGPLDKYFNKNFQLTSENNNLIKDLTKATNTLLQKQIDILTSSNKLLTEIKNSNVNAKPNIVAAPSVINNNFNSGVSLRGLQGA